MKKIISFLIIFVSYITYAAEGLDGNILSIHIIGYRNGVGLNRDIDILTEELKKLGHRVVFLDYQGPRPSSKADINIFIDVYQDGFLSAAYKNYYLPNPEWCCLTKKQLSRFDAILCKTKEAVRIFEKLHPHPLFLGFTSKDRYDPAVEKNYKMPIHVVGASIQKGTATVLKAWTLNPQFPALTVITHRKDIAAPIAHNIQFIRDYLEDAELTQKQNSCGLHICPSETEGFGHYLLEGLSTGAVVVTTGGPPMNEFITDERCLVPFQKTAPWRYAENYYVDQWKLELMLGDILSLPESTLKEMGERNREFFLKNDQAFKQRLKEVFQ